ncbi:beta strand repeat-containing protein, partial [Haemophilus influenzae]
RGEGKNGIQLAKKTSLEKGSIINVSGKEKGGRAIVWGNIALINGNINAQGSDIAKTGGFVETSGHYLSIDDNVIVKTKEWLLDPENVSIEAFSPSRADASLDSEFPIGDGDANSPKKNHETKTTLTNTVISSFLKNAKVMNITASKTLTVNAPINLQGGNLTLHTEQGGIEVNADITSLGDNGNSKLNIHSGSWIDVHSNISLKSSDSVNITAKDTIAFENTTTMISFQGKGNITSGQNKGFRFENVTLKGFGEGLLFSPPENNSNKNNFSAKFTGVLNISGNIKIQHKIPDGNKVSIINKGGKIDWNVTQLNLEKNSNFTLYSKTDGKAYNQIPHQGAGGIHFNTDTVFNVPKSSNVNFTFIYPIIQTPRGYHSQINGNLTVQGGGRVGMKFSSYDSSYYTIGIGINSKFINVTGGSTLDITGDMPAKKIFEINNDLTINAADSNVSIKEVEGIDAKLEYGLYAKNNISINGGNVTLGSKKAKTEIKGNVSVSENTDVTLQAQNYGHGKKALVVGGNIDSEGNITASGAVVEINGDVNIKQGATFKGETDYNLNITGNFTNNGSSEINIKQGVVKLGNITNDGSLNITTNAQNNQKTIINGNITNNRGDLSITDNKTNAEIQIGGNISQKEGNLTISSDKVNITKQITIKAGVDEVGSDSGAKSNANLTIKTKTLELTDNLNISGFNKAEITAKNGSDLTIGKTSSDNSNAKKVTFDKVKDSKISADGHKVTLNSKVETSNGDSNTEDSSNDNNAGLIITAKDVTVNNNITSHKTVNISAAGGIDTKAGTTINATAGSVEVTAKTGDIKGGIESASGSVNITASGNTLKVSNITGQDVTVTADAGALTTTAGSTINAITGNANITTRTGNINGKVESSSGSVTLSATGETLTVSSISGKAVTITADSGKLTTQAGSTINGTESVTTSSQSGDIGGTISGDTVSVKATGDLTTQSGSKIEATSGEANVTSATGTIDGTISGGTVNITANTGGLTIGNSARVEAINGAATLTAELGELTTQAGSSITSNNGQTTLTAKDGSIAGSIDAANVTLNTTGTLTTVASSNIKATSGTLAINAKDAKLNGAASGNRTEVNATNASGSGSVTAKTSSSVNITGDLNTINGLNIISENGRNTVRLRGKEIEVKYIQPGVASVEEVIEAKRVLEKVKDLSDEERETLAKLGVSAVRFVEPNNTITVNTQNEFTTRPSSQVTISEGKACFSSGNGAAVCTNVADDGQP